MRPSEISYELLEAPVRDLVRALNASGVAETLGSCGGHPFEVPTGAPSAIRRTHTAYVLLHVLDEEGWRDLALAVACTVQRVPRLSMSVTFDHEAQLWLTVEPHLAPIVRRGILDDGLNSAAAAVTRWVRSEASLSGD